MYDEKNEWNIKETINNLLINRFMSEYLSINHSSTNKTTINEHRLEFKYLSNKLRKKRNNWFDVLIFIFFLSFMIFSLKISERKIKVCTGPAAWDSFVSQNVIQVTNNVDLYRNNQTLTSTVTAVWFDCFIVTAFAILNN